jgi:hypothetical protein
MVGVIMWDDFLIMLMITDIFRGLKEICKRTRVDLKIGKQKKNLYFLKSHEI